MDTNVQIDRTQRIWILTGVALPLLALSTEEGFSVTAVPQAVAALNGFSRYAWPSTAFLLTSTISMPVFAKISDLYGRKWFYLLGAALSMAFALLCGAAGSLPVSPDGMTQIIVANGVLGLAHGSILVLAFTYVGDIFAPLERGRYQGLLAADQKLMVTLVTGFASVTSFEYEQRLRRKDGQYRWFLSRSTPILDQDGQIIRWCASATDNEERKQAARKYAGAKQTCWRRRESAAQEVGNTISNGQVFRLSGRIDEEDYRRVGDAHQVGTERTGDCFGLERRNPGWPERHHVPRKMRIRPYHAVELHALHPGVDQKATKRHIARDR